MKLFHRTRPAPIVVIVFVTGAALYAQAPAAAPSDGAVSPAAAAPMAPAPAATPKPSTGFSYSYSPVAGDFVNAGSPTESVLVVPGKPMDPQAVGQMAEDLSIMSRIVEKNALGESSTFGGVGEVSAYTFYRVDRRAATGPGLFFPYMGRPKPMYFGGYGAVFFIPVDYPLLPPPATPQQPQTGQPEDPVWAQTKRDILEPQPDVVLPQNRGEAPEPYNRETVDTLKTQLIAAMKHATNIRALEPTEWVVFVVRGPGATDSDKTTMTFRATKADVDQYAKGQLNQQQFEQRLQIVTY